MAKYCPVKNGPALYLECMECKEMLCKVDENKFKKKKERINKNECE